MGQWWPGRSPAPDQTPGTQQVTSSPHTGRLPILITIQHIQIQALIHDTMWTVTQRKLFRTDKLNATMSFIVLSIWGISLFSIVPAGTKYFGPLSSLFGLLSKETYILW